MTARGNSGRSSGAMNGPASTRPPAARSGTSSVPTGGVCSRMRRASAAGISVSGVGGAMTSDRKNGAPARIARHALGFQHRQPSRELDAQVVAADDRVDVQVRRQLEDFDVLVVLGAQLLD